jgi:hypothetical protein
MNQDRFGWGMAALVLLLLAAVGCHNTARGVKADTEHALEKTGQGLEKAGHKIGGHRKDDD